jgi:hypothetical protein
LLALALGIAQVESGFLAESALLRLWQFVATGIVAILLSSVIGTALSEDRRALKTCWQFLEAVVSANDLETGHSIFLFVFFLGLAQGYAGFIAESRLELYFQANATGLVGMILAVVAELAFSNDSRTFKSISQVAQATASRAFLWVRNQSTGLASVPTLAIFEAHKSKSVQRPCGRGR